jgi:hypothetical protein
VHLCCYLTFPPETQARRKKRTSHFDQINTQHRIKKQILLLFVTERRRNKRVEFSENETDNYEENENKFSRI